MPTPRLHGYSGLLRLIWPFVLVVALLALLSMGSINVLSAMRAYVAGESLWSKGQKDAIQALGIYLDTRDPAAYARYREAMSVPEGDRIARLTLDTAKPDFAAAERGLLAGGNSPADIPGMIWLFRTFRNISYMDRAISVWALGDQHLAQLDTVARSVRSAAEQGTLDAAAIRRARSELDRINNALTPIERKFSNTLGEASQAIRNVLYYSNFGAALVLILLAVWRTRRHMAERDRLEGALQASEERLQLAVSGSHYGVWDWDIPANLVYLSPQYRALFGFPGQHDQLDFDAVFARVHPEDQATVRAAMASHFADNSVYETEFRLRTADDCYRWYHAHGQASRDGTGIPQRMAGTFEDVTERKRMEAALQAEQERALVTLASIGDAVLTTDTQGSISYMNPAAEVLLGVRHATGLRFSTTCHLIDEARNEQEFDPVGQVLAGESADTEGRNLWLIRKDGSETAVRLVAAPMHDEAGHIAGAALAFHDMTRERQFVAHLSWQASHDELTGLVNRREFEQRLGRLLAERPQRVIHHALLFLDLDQFKLVNDTSGHASGDELLRQVCSTLQRHLRVDDTLARLGGDEFGVILQGCRLEPATRIAETLREAIETLHFAWGGQPFNISVSIGLVALDDTPYTLEDSMRAADVACYMAKEKGRNRVQHYQPGDAEITVRYGEMEWVQRIHRALEEHRFCLYAQDIVALAEPDHRHVELLLRLINDDGSVVPPSAFIPAAERYNLMPLLDRWVVRTALASMRQQPETLICSINLSGASIGDDAFLEFVCTQLQDSGVEASHVCFEITETTAIANLNRATLFIHALKARGCRFSLDDFGAGMSSFAYLKHLPVDYLKIDGAFVKGMVNDASDRAMVEAINHIGHVMGKRTIAEFVENEAILTTTREIGIDYAQGYALCRPQPFSLPDAAATPLHTERGKDAVS
ncbi:PAS domain S-box-containing protein/diguanylate cyclase (GGDEF) domain-containing protein [Andreprevotia lacus DSM 23236]|uniref:PAS domain S-box-containing protein/diguanylate cyclase (GGDEF) domain-containing protein n=1 Tax=Andreprevotia lacus DSM 23236 TaxID=1121001 RepID=A0A1W1XMP4_9NEIS|nr:EAL domain-containing protein [Andreprevotia lacus]SMC25223.1 PAS domain S-box-containing protein/diguanylate cyclase (GGDEF) domain-containing protein [Andreprevotia lacus DSM 23236]